MTAKTKLPDGQTLEYEVTPDGWLVGQIVEVPEALSQGRTLEKLIENVLDARTLLREECDAKPGQPGRIGFRVHPD